MMKKQATTKKEQCQDGSLFDFSPIHIHFIDRELLESVGCIPSVADIQKALRILLLATPSQLYGVLPHVWEGYEYFSTLLPLFGKLIRSGNFLTVSTQATLQEFITTRQGLYTFDKRRYRWYYDDVPDVLLQFRPMEVKGTSTTEFLQDELLHWGSSSTKRDMVPSRGYHNDVIDYLRPLLSDALLKREDQAVTYSLFRPSIEQLDKRGLLEGAMRRRISELFTWHYMDFLEGDLATGFVGLNYYDHLARSFPCYDLPLLQLVSDWCGVGLAGAGENNREWDELLALRGQPVHQRFSQAIRALVCGCHEEVSRGRPAIPMAASRPRIANCARTYMARSEQEAHPPDRLIDALERAHTWLEHVLASTPLATSRVAEEYRNPTVGKNALMQTGRREDNYADTAPLKLVHTQLGRLHRALVSAFPSRKDLDTLVYLGFGLNVDNLCKYGELDGMILDVIRWFKSRGQLEDLVRRAFWENPTNPELSVIAEELIPGIRNEQRQG
jgi:effector-associated domain 1 (EAD1)-containing protein